MQIALDMRGKRATYAVIAAHLGVTPGRGHQIVMEAIEYVTEELKESAGDVLVQELAGLDEIERRAWLRMDKDGKDGFSMDAVRTLMLTKERRAKYLGLDAPVDMRVGFFNAPRGVPVSSEVELESLTVPELEELERAEITRGRILMKARKVAPESLDPSLEVAPPVAP